MNTEGLEQSRNYDWTYPSFEDVMPTGDDELSHEEGSLAELEWDHRLPRDDPIHGSSTFT